MIGGVLALARRQLAAARRLLPHDPLDGVSALTYDPARSLNVLAWPFLCFAAVLMVTLRGAEPAV